MANQETQQIDSIIASRRAMLLSGGAALAAMAMTKPANAALTVASYTDNDILNFALNLEYLEANFYYLAAFGTTINVQNPASMAAGAPQVAITGTVGTAGTVTANGTPTGPVPFTLAAVKAYAIETAIEEARHVAFLRTTLGSLAVAQPALNLAGGAGQAAGSAFNAVAASAIAGIVAPATAPAPLTGGVFNPYSSDLNFLLGAYIFEDVGVTAYKGAAPLITQTAMGKTYLSAAASILAVEAYHAALVRTTIFTQDPTDAQGYITSTARISTLRSTLAKAADPSVPATNDIPLTLAQMATIAGTSSGIATLVDGDLTNVLAFSRGTTAVLNIVTGGGAATAGTKATGAFFPAGMNGVFA